MIARPHSILLDAEALSVLAAGGRRMQAWAVAARRTDSVLYVSAATLAGVADGGARDAKIRLAAKAVRVQPVTDVTGYAAGRLRASAAGGRRKVRDLTVDALVAATALGLPAPALVLTSDPGDLGRLLAGTRVGVEAIG
jgi:predicted nucleic acid-binding protein